MTAIGPVPRQAPSMSTFDTTPLFMRELPTGHDDEADESDKHTLAALQSLIHEGSPQGKPSNNAPFYLL